MPIPPFIAELRARIGTDLLWLTGVTAVVLDEQQRVLLTRRADTGRWALVSGILEPGEQPAVAMVREIAEETGVEALVEVLYAVDVTEPMTYPNGDESQYLDLLFLARATGGHAHVADDESLEVGWFGLDALPEGTGHHTPERIALLAEFRADPAAGPRLVRVDPPAAPVASPAPDDGAAPAARGVADATVRTATPDDAATVGALLHDFNVEFDSPTPSADELTARFATLLTRPDAVVHLAEHDGAAVGFAYLTLRPTPYFDGPLAQLEELYVRPGLRDRGIGTQLLTAAVAHVRSVDGGEIHINVDEVDVDTRRFYERHGFVNIQPGEDYRMLCYLREL